MAVRSAFVVLLALAAARAVILELRPNEDICIVEEIRADVPVEVVYELINSRPDIDGFPALHTFWVAGDNGKELFRKDESHRGSFAVVPSVDDEITICARDTFRQHNGDTKRELKLKIVHKNDMQADEQPLQVELNLVEDQAKHIKSEMEYQNKREQELRDVNEITNSRVAWLSVFSLAIIVCSVVWQMITLRTFFQKKKLL
eukprot:m51a1_g790 putative C-tail anchored protein, emp24/gp25L/p24 family/GOLD (202) ;mRNA; f:632123-632990